MIYRLFGGGETDEDDPLGDVTGELSRASIDGVILAPSNSTGEEAYQKLSHLSAVSSGGGLPKFTERAVQFDA